LHPLSKDPVDAPPAIAQILSLQASDLILKGNKVLIEADTRASSKVGSIWMPVMKDQAYPTSGWVVSTGPDVSEVKEGDFVLLEDEGANVDTTYYDLFEVILKHDDGFIETIWVEVEVEPVIREQVHTFRRGGKNSVIRVADKKKGGTISFNCSNVLDFQIGDMSNPSVALSYVPVFMLVMMNNEDMPALFYFTDPSRILAVVEY
jgi:hypothetical protein